MTWSRPRVPRCWTRCKRTARRPPSRWWSRLPDQQFYKTLLRLRDNRLHRFPWLAVLVRWQLIDRPLIDRQLIGYDNSSTVQLKDNWSTDNWSTMTNDRQGYRNRQLIDSNNSSTVKEPPFGSYCLARWSWTCQHLYPAPLPLNQAAGFANQNQPICNIKVKIYHFGHLGRHRWAIFVECLIQRKEGRIQVLASLAPSSQTVGSNMRILRCHLWWLLQCLLLMSYFLKASLKCREMNCRSAKSWLTKCRSTNCHRTAVSPQSNIFG